MRCVRCPCFRDRELLRAHSGTISEVHNRVEWHCMTSDDSSNVICGLVPSPAQWFPFMVLPRFQTPLPAVDMPQILQRFAQICK
jgi:hypothetical protein